MLTLIVVVLHEFYEKIFLGLDPFFFFGGQCVHRLASHFFFFFLLCVIFTLYVRLLSNSNKKDSLHLLFSHFLFLLTYILTHS